MDSCRARHGVAAMAVERIEREMNDRRAQRERSDSCVGDGKRWDHLMAIDEEKTKERKLPT